ncbi:MAG: transaldolase family protein, partial [Halieaceae bacterium]
VGRILDWYKANTELIIEQPQDDPGVQSVARIYNYYKQHDYKTVVMGASFRNTGEIEALAGCDRLTISPALMEALSDDEGQLPRQLNPDNAASEDSKHSPGESEFRYELNDDAMATEKLAEGIRNFVIDQIKLEQLISAR